MPRTVDPVVAQGTMASVPQPTLEVDDELTLRPFRRRDAADVMAAFDDPAIQRWHSYRVDSLIEAYEWIGRGHLSWLREQGAHWAIVGPDDRLTGRVAVYTNIERGTGEVAYWVLPHARRRRVALRAVAAVTEWSHGSLGLGRILLQHSVDNAASCAVATRLGYELEGVARAADLHGDGWHAMHQHSHLADG